MLLSPVLSGSGVLWLCTLDSIFISTIAFHHSRHRPWFLVTAALHKSFQKQPSLTLICYLKKKLNLAGSCTGILAEQPSLRWQADLFPRFLLRQHKASQRHNRWRFCMSQQRTMAHSQGELGDRYSYLCASLDKMFLGCIRDHKPEENCKQCK